MVLSVTSELVGEQKLISRFDGYAGSMSDTIMRAMTRIAFYLVAYVKEEKLSGQVLARRTGTLSRSIKGLITTPPGQIVADITSRDKGNAPLPYASFWENGFHGTQEVRSHIRHMASGNTVSVKQFIRDVNQNARPFFKPTRDENKAYVQEALQNAISEENSK